MILGPLCTECDPNTNLTRALSNEVSHHSVDAGSCQHERDA